ncbi:hypothetical protein LTR16_002194 [Cryomyces antarcticus]|uniref:Ribosomal RNA-processing protein 17 n=1 Tax=Cryomyces antarcticus TaxID=329879 RepID=A0ABR0KUH7_9PEZI|nr:hypothetical protein LTR16_002194 [Cryomyces antarcticus]
MAPPAKRRKTLAVEEIKFDPSAREDYLTGFHKRKLQRQKHAQEEASKRDREERVRDRRQLREQRKEDLEKHVAEVNALLRKAAGDSSGEDSQIEGDDGERREEWTGIEEPPEINREDEYVDEDRYTTVTVETMDVSRESLQKAGEEERGGGVCGLADSVAKPSAVNGRTTKKRIWTKDKPADAKQKPKKKKFRYESKAERKVTRQKQKSRGSAAAKTRRGA